MTPAALAHASVLLAIFFAVKAWSYHLTASCCSMATTASLWVQATLISPSVYLFSGCSWAFRSSQA